MSNIVYVFPGVGSQRFEMGRYFYNTYNIARNTFEEASDCMHIDFEKICLHKDGSVQLNNLEIAQLSLVCTGVAIYRVIIQETGLKPDYGIGYSLGEYTALCCANAINFPDALQLVRERSQVIQEASSKLKGTMSWVLNLKINTVEEICDEFRKKGFPVYISSYDSEEKVSVSLTNEMVRQVGEAVVDQGGILYPINVSGPYHSPLMREAALIMRRKLTNYSYREPEFQVIGNANARIYSSVDDLVEYLSRQIEQPIRWKESIEYVLGQGCEDAIEIGPKNVLQYLIGKNTDKITCYTTDNEADYKNIIENLFIKQQDIASIYERCLVLATGTPNYNRSTSDYQQGVVQPYHSMLERYKAMKDTPDAYTIEHARLAKDALTEILKTKGMNKKQQRIYLNKLTDNKFFRDCSDKNTKEFVDRS